MSDEAEGQLSQDKVQLQNQSRSSKISNSDLRRREMNESGIHLSEVIKQQADSKLATLKQHSEKDIKQAFDSVRH